MKETRELLKLLRRRIFQIFIFLFVLLLAEILFVNTFYNTKIVIFVILDVISQMEFLLFLFIVFNIIAAIAEWWLKGK
jgi:hypothetical protein